jgi:hypothetical protein
MQPDQLPVQLYGCRTGSQTEYHSQSGGLPFSQQFADALGHFSDGRVGRFAHACFDLFVLLKFQLCSVHGSYEDADQSSIHRDSA